MFDPPVYQECLARLHKIEEDTKPHWGSMTAAQMMAHCAEIQEVANGKKLEKTPFMARLFKGFIRKMVVNDKPYPKSTQTHPQYKQIEDKNFPEEKARLLEALQKFQRMDPQQAANIRHPLFGTMTIEEKGWSSYKHLDHHLTQFGV